MNKNFPCTTLFFEWSAIHSLTFCSLLLAFSAAADVPFTRATIDNNLSGFLDCKAVGDIDGDSLPDVVIGGSSALMWYRYPAWTRTVIANPNVEFTTDMQTGDVDGDGDLDIIVPDGGSGNNMVWFENPRPGGNPAAGAWTRRSIGSVGANAHDVEVGDLNGDSRLDVVARQPDGQTMVFFQNTPTSWTKVTMSAAIGGEGTTLGDIDRDGDLDIVENGYWLQNPRPGGDPLNGSSWTRRNINTSWPSRVAVTTADLNNDNRLDVLLAHSESTGRMVWYEAPVDPINGAWIERGIDASVDYAHTFKTADINLDGQLDVVFAEMAQSRRKRVGVYFNNGGGLSWQLQVLSTSGSHNIRVVDFGNDGDIDIVGANWQGPPVEWWENQGGVPSDATPPTITSVTASNASTVRVLFSEPVTTASAQTASNYSINNGVTISSAVLGADTRTVTLTTSTLGGGNYTLTVNNVTDRASPPNAIAPNSQASFSFTPPTDTAPPSGPLNLSGSATTSTTAQLAWQAATDNVGVTQYVVSRSGTQVATLPGSQTSFQDTGLSPATTYSYQVVARDAAGNASSPATVSVTTPPGGGSTAVVRVNTGSGAFTDTAGNNWSADFGFNGGFVNSTSVGISGTANDALFQSERWSSGPLLYSFNLPSGNYTVNLYFAEIWSGAFAVGGRVFDVSIEGQLRIDNLDIYSQVGANAALIISLPVTVSDGQLNISFTSVIQNPKISAIEVLGAQPSGDTTLPTLSSVTASNASTVRVLFSEPVTTASAQTAGNYSINNGVTISSAVLGADTRTVTLTTSTLGGGNYTLTVNNVTDRASPPNAIAPNSQASFSFTPPTDTTPPSGLLAHWRFDENTGFSASDSSGNGRTGALINGADWTVGQAGSALNLDGINDYVSVPNLDVVGSGITLAAWVNLASLPTSSDARIISKASNSSEASHWWMLGHTYSGGNHRLRFRLKTGGVTTTLIASTGNLTANTWVHAAATYDGSTMRLYLNGVEVGSRAKTGAINVDASVAVNLGRNPEGSNYLLGRLDEVLIYERSLSPTEIKQVMNDTVVTDTTALTIVSESVVNVSSVQAAGLLSIQDSGDNRVTVNFNGTPGTKYTLQATSKLTPPVLWENIVTSVAGTNGIWTYTESTKSERRFYRMLIQQ